MMNYSSFDGSLVKSLVALVALAVIVGGIATLGYTDNDLVNFAHASAEADQIRANTAWENELRQIERPHIVAEMESEAQVALAQAEGQKKIVEAQTEAQLATAQAEMAARISQIEEEQRLLVERNNQRLAAEAKAFEVGIMLIGFFGVAFVIVFAFASLKALLRLVGNIPIQQAVQQTTQPNRWSDLHFRKQQIELARNREFQVRKSTATQNYVIQNGHQHQGTLTPN